MIRLEEAFLRGSSGERFHLIDDFDLDKFTSMLTMWNYYMTQQMLF